MSLAKTHFEVTCENGLVEFRVDGRRVAHFPAWEHADRDLRHFTMIDIPTGTADLPFDESDEGWRIVIYEDGDSVHILEGDDPHDDELPRRTRVPRDEYFAAWEFLIDAFNPIEPVDSTYNPPE